MNEANRLNRKVLEELKAMGRMDGDMVDSAGEARTIEGWRQECERLRGLGDLVVKLQAERQGWLDRIKANDATYDSLQREHRELKAECERLKTRQYTVKNSPIPESAKHFDEPVPFVELKSLGDLLSALPLSLEIEYGPMYSGRSCLPTKFTLKSSK